MDRKPLLLSDEEFKKSFEFSPRFAINLLAIRGDEILLTKRSIPPYKDSWHIPGSLLKKYETIDECIVRIGKNELGVRLDPKNKTLLGLFENLYQDPRGHIVEVIFRIENVDAITKSTDESQSIEYFRTPPDNIGFNHADYLKTLGYLD